MKIKLQVALHRKHHDGSVIVRLHQIDAENAPFELHQVIELHARSDEALAAFRAPTEEKFELFVNGTYRDAYGQSHDKIDRKIVEHVKEGAVFEIDFAPVA